MKAIRGIKVIKLKNQPIRKLLLLVVRINSKLRTIFKKLYQLNYYLYCKQFNN